MATQSKSQSTAVATVVMTKTKETPGAVRYDVPRDQADGATLTNLYVRKQAFAGTSIPDAITVTVTPA